MSSLLTTRVVKSLPTRPGMIGATSVATPRFVLVEQDGEFDEKKDSEIHVSSSPLSTSSGTSPISLAPSADHTAPTSLAADTKLLRSSAPFRSLMIRSLGRGKSAGMIKISTQLGTSLDFVTLGTGQINASVAVATIASVTEFPLWASLFDEYFVTRMRVVYVPFNRYQFNSVTPPATTETSVPFTSYPLFHGVSAYGTMAASVENGGVAFHTSADPFTVHWVNNESPSSGVMVNPSTSVAGPTQGWCLTSATPAAAYQGSINFLSSALLGTAAAKAFGNLFVKWEVIFRVRV